VAPLSFSLAPAPERAAAATTVAPGRSSTIDRPEPVHVIDTRPVAWLMMLGLATWAATLTFQLVQMIVFTIDLARNNIGGISVDDSTSSTVWHVGTVAASIAPLPWMVVVAVNARRANRKSKRPVVSIAIAVSASAAMLWSLFDGGDSDWAALALLGGIFLSFKALMRRTKASAKAIGLTPSHILTWSSALYAPISIAVVANMVIVTKLNSLVTEYIVTAVIAAALLVGSLLQSFAAARTAREFDAEFERLRLGRPRGRVKVCALGTLRPIAFASSVVLIGGLVPWAAGVRALEAMEPAFSDELQPLADFVERERELSFKRYVPVEFLEPAEFATLLAGAEPTSDDGAEGLGLADTEQLTTQADREASATLAFYVAELEIVVVNGTRLTSEVKVVVVHELVHALQDQHFDSLIEGTDLASMAMLEGDAERVAAAYRATLSDAEQRRIDAAIGATDGYFDGPLSALDQEFVAPYVLGRRLVTSTFDAGGNAAVDALFREPMAGRRVLSPWLPLDTPVESVPAVTAPAGAAALSEPTPMDPLRQLILLDAWLPYAVARDAMDTWEGGSYITWRASGEDCITVVSSATPGSVALLDALTIVASSTNAGQVAAAGDVITLTMCGTTTPLEPAVSTLRALAYEIDAVLASADEPSLEACAARRSVDVPEAQLLLVAGQLTDDDRARLADVRTLLKASCPQVAAPVDPNAPAG
jgi:hypothetical protein